MALCNVTGTVYLPNGQIAANRRIVFRREVRNITAEYLGAMFPDDVITTTSATGEIDVNLVTGRYIAFATGSNISFFGVAVVPDAATANFADILNLDDIPDTPPVWYQQALDARDAATEASQQAEEDSAAAALVASSIKSGSRADFVARNSSGAFSDWDDGATILIDGETYVRDASASSIGDIPGWTVGLHSSPEKMGAVGDGIADDTDAIQAALDSSGSFLGRFGAVYRITRPLIIGSDTTIDTNGAKLLRDFSGDWLIKNANATGPGTDSNIDLKLWMEDTGAEQSRGPFLLMSRVNDLRISGLKVRASSPNVSGGSFAAWGAYISGGNIKISGVDIDNATCGLYGDGLHFGVVNGLVLQDYHIIAGDDALAFHFLPASYAIAGEHGTASGISVGSGYVESSHANGLRIGAWPDSHADDVWTNLSVSGINFGPCASSPIQIYDNRPASGINGKNDNIQLRNINLGRQGAAGARLINIMGNPDISNINNINQKNFGSIIISSAYGVKDSLQFIRAGGVDKLALIECGAEMIGSAYSSTQMEFRQVNRLSLDGADFKSNTSATSVGFTHCQDIDIKDGSFNTDLNSYSAFSVVLTSMFPTNFRMLGGRVAGHQRLLTTSGDGTFGDFIVDGIDAATTVSISGVKAASRYSLRPSLSLPRNVGDLPTGVTNGTVIFASNARKTGEAASSGTGCLVYYDDGVWRLVSDDTTVTV